MLRFDLPSRWKHAAACHQGSTIPGETDVFVEDAVYAAVREASDGDGTREDADDGRGKAAGVEAGRGPAPDARVEISEEAGHDGQLGS